MSDGQTKPPCHDCKWDELFDPKDCVCKHGGIPTAPDLFEEVEGILKAPCGYRAMQQAMIDLHRATCEKCKGVA